MFELSQGLEVAAELVLGTAGIGLEPVLGRWGPVQGLGLGWGFVQVQPESVLGALESDQAPLESVLDPPESVPGTDEGRFQGNLGLLGPGLV